MEYCFGVDIGGTTVKMGLFTIEGKLLEKWEIKTRTEQEGEAILPDVADSLNQKMEEKKLGKEQVSGIGIGIPAPVNAEGIVQNTANLGWGYKEVRKEMEDLTQMKVAVGNDANMAALGEMWLGAGKGEKNLIMVTLGTGVGGGVIVNGQPVVGATERAERLDISASTMKRRIIADAATGDASNNMLPPLESPGWRENA